ncbi:DUF5074 domain-containing protein [uncultured Alistipes sp.]|uniref:DUF5074 domain-containing protein n=1 Tax=uncultured Alistipes sp. TaxID=538949 RepID=UPI0026197DDA|nr:DUF5074 domain-containing protein [uncultured Alistipes sp.]
MKKFFFCAAAFALIAGCSKESGSNEDPTNPGPESNPPKIENIELSNGATFDGSVDVAVASEPLTISLTCKNTDTFRWSLDGQVVEGADTNSYVFSDTEWSGSHTVTVELGNNTTAEKIDSSFVIDVYGPYKGKLLAVAGDGAVTVLEGDYTVEEQGLSIGRVPMPQRVVRFGSELFVVSAGGAEPLVVADAQTLKRKKTIAGDGSGDKTVFPDCGTPYTVTKVDDTKAYVICAMNASTGGFMVADLTEKKIVRHVVVAKNVPEPMVRAGENLLGVTSESVYTVDPETDAVTTVAGDFGANRSVVGIAADPEGAVYVAVGAEDVGMSAVEGSSAKIVKLNGKSFAVEKEYPLEGVLLNSYSMGMYISGSGLACTPDGKALVFYGTTAFGFMGGTTNIYRYDLTTEKLTVIQTGLSLGSSGSLDLSGDAKTAFAGMGDGPYAYMYDFYRYDLESGTQTRLCAGGSYAAGSVIDLR